MGSGSVSGLVSASGLASEPEALAASAEDWVLAAAQEEGWRRLRHRPSSAGNHDGNRPLVTRVRGDRRPERLRIRILRPASQSQKTLADRGPLTGTMGRHWNGDLRSFSAGIVSGVAADIEAAGRGLLVDVHLLVVDEDRAAAKNRVGIGRRPGTTRIPHLVPRAGT